MEVTKIYIRLDSIYISKQYYPEPDILLLLFIILSLRAVREKP